MISSRVVRLLILPDAADLVELKNVELVPAKDVSPLIQLISAPLNYANVPEVRGNAVRVRFNSRSVPGAVGAELEISKPNCFYDNFEDITDQSPVQTTVSVRSCRGMIELSGASFKGAFQVPGYYQMRAFCLDVNGNRIGEASEPLTIMRI